MRPACLLVLLLSVLASGAMGQMFRDRRPDQASQFLFYEAINLPSSDSTMSRVDIHYRLDREYFIPVRNTDTSFAWPFKRRGEVVVELLDSTGGSRARDIDRVELGENSDEPLTGVKQWYQGIVSFNVSPGPYKVQFEVDDLESRRSHLDQHLMVRAESFRGKGIQLSTPMIVTQTSLTDSLVTENFGGDVRFGSSDGLFLEMTTPAEPQTPVQITYEIVVPPPFEKDSTVIRRDTINAVPLLRGIFLTPRKDAQAASYDIRRSGSPSVAGLIVPLKTEMLPLRHYILKLTVKQGDSRKELLKRFRMVWPEMPLSLRDVDEAIEALRYITSEAQLDSLRRGNDEERRNHLEEFWHRRDQTPGTAYNEVMTEYYRRVDYATREFGTLRQPDGFKSDRGRIYILFGPPSHTERILDPSTGFKETWTYDRLNKKFAFVDRDRSGNYILVATVPQ